MSAYRDGFEACPRCAVSLEDAGSVRRCPACRGLWIDREVVAEMIQNMLPPTGLLGRLELAVVERAERIACPNCSEAMQATRIHEVELDACSKGHGVWFDADELQSALHAVTRPGGSPLVPLPERTSLPRPASVQRSPTDLPVIYLRQLAPREGLAERFCQGVIKIGRLESAHFRVENSDLSRMHAVIDVTPEHIQIIDLGSALGTQVDGEKVNKADLHDGARLQFGSVVVEVRVGR